VILNTLTDQILSLTYSLETPQWIIIIQIFKLLKVTMQNKV